MRLSGEAPRIDSLRLPDSVAKVCGPSLQTLAVERAADGALKGVVVELAVVELAAVELATVDWETTSSGPWADAGTVTVDQRRCAFLPTVLAVQVGTTLVFQNSDPLIHNVRAGIAGRQLFNFAMPLEGMKTSKRFTEPGIVELKCDVHPWMHAWVKVLAHSAFALTDERGRYRISGVPSGHQRLRFWHPRLGERTLEVQVPADRPAVQALDWSH